MRRAEGICYLLAAACLVLGALLAGVFTALRFTGLLLCCAAAFWAALGLLSRWSAKRRWARRTRRALLGLTAAGIVLFAAMEIRVLSWAGTDTETPVSAVVVLGAGVNGTEPSLSLLVRLEAALAYLRDKPPGVPVVVSGSQGRGEEISEARCMADWLIARGVDRGCVLLEERAGNTRENIAFSLALLEERGVNTADPIAVVTSDYHLCRAAVYVGENMVPVAASMPARYLPLTVNYYVREAFALAAALLLP